MNFQLNFILTIKFLSTDGVHGRALLGGTEVSATISSVRCDRVCAPTLKSCVRRVGLRLPFQNLIQNIKTTKNNTCARVKIYLLTRCCDSRTDEGWSAPHCTTDNGRTLACVRALEIELLPQRPHSLSLRSTSTFSSTILLSS